MMLYRQYKAYAEDAAMEWQNDFNNHIYSYGELVYFPEHFAKVAKRYSLAKLFRENGTY